MDLDKEREQLKSQFSKIKASYKNAYFKGLRAGWRPEDESTFRYSAKACENDIDYKKLEDMEKEIELIYSKVYQKGYNKMK